MIGRVPLIQDVRLVMNPTRKKKSSQLLITNVVLLLAQSIAEKMLCFGHCMLIMMSSDHCNEYEYEYGSSIRELIR
jgi:hypothetical protein